MSKKIFLLLLSFFVFINGFAKTLKIKKKDLKKLNGMMAGEYSSEAQAKADASFANMKMYIKPIWTDEINGYWYYVEQVGAGAEDKPTSQKVYYIYKQDDTTIVNKTYNIKNASQYTGAWKDANKLSILTLDSLIDNQNCSIFLQKRKNNVYSGSTNWRQCSNNFKNATYASTEIVIYKKKLVRWERGWNESDRQVWGSIKGGNIFIRKKKF